MEETRGHVTRLERSFAQFGKQPDEKTNKPNGSIQYEIVKNGVEKPVLDYTEQLSQIPGASAQQVTIEKLLPLMTLEPGQYTLKMKVVDKNRDQVLTPSANFTVK